MTTFEIILSVLFSIGLIFVFFLYLRTNTKGNNDETALKEIGKLQKDVEVAQKEKNEIAGKGKQLYDNFKSMESELKVTLKERDALQKSVSKYEALYEQREKEYQQMAMRIEAAEKALKEERQRVIREDEERLEEREKERDRLWAEHEHSVIASLHELCKQPQLQFTTFTNTNLPEEFDGSLKPDFLLKFLNQYVIFDAKVSKAQSLQAYIDDAVKKTAEKVRKNQTIYPHIFLVVPTEAISELKKLVYAKDEYYFYIVSREALAPILASLKRISTYELAETLDPQKRENIIHMLSELSTHIAYRNAHELLLTKMGADTLERVSKTDPELAEEVEQKNTERKLTQLSVSEIKRIASSLTAQNTSIQELTSPKPSVKKKMVEVAELVMSERLL